MLIILNFLHTLSNSKHSQILCAADLDTYLKGIKYLRMRQGICSNLSRAVRSLIFRLFRVSALREFSVVLPVFQYLLLWYTREWFLLECIFYMFHTNILITEIRNCTPYQSITSRPDLMWRRSVVIYFSVTLYFFNWREISADIFFVWCLPYFIEIPTMS